MHGTVVYAAGGELLSSLTRLVIQLTNVEYRMWHSETLSFITAPSVLQFLKTVLILGKKALSSAPSDVVENCLWCLERLLGKDAQGNCNHDAVLCTPDAYPNRDAAGLSLHSHPRLSMQELETDASLLHALSAHLIADPSGRRLLHNPVFDYQ